MVLGPQTAWSAYNLSLGGYQAATEINTLAPCMVVVSELCVENSVWPARHQ